MKRKSVRSPHIIQSSSNQWIIPVLSVLVAVLSILAAIYLSGGAVDHCEQCKETLADNQFIQGLQDKVTLLEKERDEYRLKAAQYERASQIDQNVVSTVQTDLKSLQAERAELRQQVEFLKSLVSGDITSLQLIDFRVEKAAQKDTYGYNLKISKRAKGQDKVQGRLIFSIKGKLDGKTKILAAKDLDLTGSNLGMGFQNFQNYKGSFKLPDKFKPEIFNIKVVPKGDKFKSFEKDFPWSLVIYD